MKKNIITEQFVQDLKKLYELGVDMNPQDFLAKEILQEMFIIKEKNKDYVYNENPILDLIQNYEISSFNIGAISFYELEDLIEDENYIALGSDGAGDLIVIKKNTGQVLTLDGYFEELLICSEDSKQFLESLIEIGNAKMNNISNEQKYELAKKISKNSGGNIDFYIEALGVDE